LLNIAGLETMKHQKKTSTSDPLEAPLFPTANLMRQFAAVVSVCHRRLAVMESQTARMALMNLAASVLRASSYVTLLDVSWDRGAVMDTLTAQTAQTNRAALPLLLLFVSLMNGSVIMGPVLSGGFDVMDVKTAHETILTKETAGSVVLTSFSAMIRLASV